MTFGIRALSCCDPGSATGTAAAGRLTLNERQNKGLHVNLLARVGPCLVAPSNVSSIRQLPFPTPNPYTVEVTLSQRTIAFNA